MASEASIVSGLPLREMSSFTFVPGVVSAMISRSSSHDVTVTSLKASTTSPRFSPAFSAGESGVTSVIIAPRVPLGRWSASVSSAGTAWAEIPRKPRATVPVAMRLCSTDDARLIGMAKPRPMLPREVEMMALLIPTSRPLASTSAPPELPMLIEASVWMKLS